jgi:hypothetical protein
MALATTLPKRHDLAMRTTSDEIVPFLLVHGSENGHEAIPIGIAAAMLTLRFDLPNDDTWLHDPDTDEPLQPERQIVVINDAGSVGTPPGWIDDSRYPLGEVLTVISHALWPTVTLPYTGTWELVAVTVDDLQRVLARGEFVCETGADAP